jgi:hypothetical protein
MKKIYLFILAFLALSSAIDAQRVRGTIRKGPNNNSVIISIRPTANFTALMSNLILSVQVPTSVGTRPTVSIVNLNTNLFGAWDAPLSQDQGDGYYTFGFNNVTPGPGNSGTTVWTGNTEIDILQVNFTGGAVATSNVRLCHYLDGGDGGYAIFYVETNLNLVNGGVLSDWGNLFYSNSSEVPVNGSVATGNLGVNANLSYLNVAGIGLPLTWLNFTAVKQDKNALLNWAVQETNNNHFEIERSVNGVDFAQIGSNVVSKGAGSNNYSMTDAELINLKSNVVYYRIKQVDNDGKFTYSKVATIKLSTDKNYNIGIYPNPVNDNTTLTIDVAKATRAQVKVIDAAGKTVQTLSLVLNAGVNQKKINFSTLANGSYNVNVMSEDGLQETLKVVKQ